MENLKGKFKREILSDENIVFVKEQHFFRRIGNINTLFIVFIVLCVSNIPVYAVPPDMVQIPGGKFQMGDSKGDWYSNELPVHTVTIDSFYMGKYNITNGQYCQYLNSALSQGLITVIDDVVHKAGSGTSYNYCDTFTSDDYVLIAYSGGVFTVRTRDGRSMVNDPVENVSWYGAAAYCNWRSQQEGRQQCYNLSTWTCDFSKRGYRLPTEAEWEFAARGGLSGMRFPWGDTITHSQANYDSHGYERFDISPTRGCHPIWNCNTSPVGSFAANGYGLYDIAGNTQEWCNDWYSKTYYSSSPLNNPTGPSADLCIGRVLRGGGNTIMCRVAWRDYYRPIITCYGIGFRIVLGTGTEPECPPMPPHEPWSFVHITDVHVGRGEKAEANWDYTISEILKITPKPDFVLVTGDEADEGCDKDSQETDHYKDFKRYMDDKLAKNGIPYQVVPGNHDRRKYAAGPFTGGLCTCAYEGLCYYRENFPLDYFFTYKDFLFIGLDSGDGYPRGEGLSDPQYDFLYKLGQAKPCMPKILFMHHPAIDPDAPNESIERTDGHAADGTAINLFNWCDDNNVSLVLAGHTHKDNWCNRYGVPPDPSVPWIGPLYVQTPSCAVQDVFNDPIGFRIIDIDNGLAYWNPYQKTTVPAEKTGKLNSPGHLHVYDSGGGYIGVSAGGEVEYGIPDSFYHSHYTVEREDGTKVFPETIRILNPTDHYLWEVVGTEEGTYRLDITSTGGGEETTFDATEIPTSPGARHIYAVNWTALSAGDEDAIVLEIDTDGDGIFERTIIADENLTSEEFALQTETVIDFEPDTLNLRSPGKVVTVYIELPEGIDVSNIDVSTLKLNDTIFALSKPVKIGDYDEDGTVDLMVKFDRQQVIEVLDSGTQIVALTGRLSDGRPLAGIDFIRVIDGKNDEAVKSEVDWIMSEEFIAELEANLQTTEKDTADKGDDETFDVEESASFALFEVGDIISRLGPESFNSQESAIELANEIEAVFTMMSKGLLTEALVVLESDILEKTDGCANIAEPDENDWITSFEAQALVYPLVVETIELLQILVEQFNTKLTSK